jgi:hypothetical protein
MERVRGRPNRLGVGVVVALAISAATGCLADAAFQSKTAPDFPLGGAMTVAVFGVYKDGMMSADAWDTLGPKLSRPFHADACDVAYGPKHLTKDPAVLSAIEEYARDNGVSDELLAEATKAATSDLVVVFTVAGAPKKASILPRGPSPRAIQRGRMTPAPPRGSRAARIAAAQYTVAASIYSTKEHRSVGYLAMRYAGSSEDEALASFNDKLAAMVPNAKCVPVEDAPVDVEKIHALTQAASQSADREDPASPAPSP